MLERIFSFTAKHYKLLIFLFLLFILAIFLAQYSFLNVSVSDSQQDGDISIELRKAGETKSQPARQGLNIVRTGNYIVAASDDNKSSELPAKVRQLRSTSLAIDLQPQRNVSKIAGDTAGCIFSDNTIPKNGFALSYNCYSKGSLLKHTYGNAPAKNPLYSDVFFNTTPYMNGALGFVSSGGTNVALTYADSTQKKPLNYSSSLPDNINDLQIVVFENSGSQPFAIIRHDTGEVIFFNSLASTSPQKFTFTKGDITQASAAGKSLLIFTADTGTRTSSADSENLETLKDLTLSRYTISNGQLSENSSLLVDETGETASFQQVSDDLIISTSFSDDAILYQANNELQEIRRISNIDRVYTGGGVLLIQRGDSLYRYIPENQELRLIYKMDDLSLSSAQIVGGNIIIGGAVKGAGTYYNYLVQDTEREDQPIDKVVSYPSDGSFVSYVDYSGNKIYAVLDLLYITSSKTTGQVSFDEKEVSDKKAELMRKLESNGIDLSVYTLTTKP